jgi:hypothetical protein
MNNLFNRCWWMSPALTGVLLLLQKIGGKGVIGYWIIPISFAVVMFGSMVGVFGLLAAFHATSRPNTISCWVKATISFSPFIWALIILLPQIIRL